MSTTIPRPEYPRPQFQRNDWVNLNGEWAFAFDDADAGLTQRWYETEVSALRGHGSPFNRTITVPFCFQAPLSGIGETAFHDVVWYARTFDSPLQSDEQDLLLHFGAVDYRATVWVNGHKVATHEGGHTPFVADITAVVRPTENVLIVRAEDPSEDVTIPRGKQFWKAESAGIYYTRTTGIWQTVWLEPVSRRRIGSLRMTPQVDVGALDVEIAVHGDTSGLTLRVVASRAGETVVDERVAVQSSLIDRRLNLRRRTLSHGTKAPALWSPEHPNLYDLRLELLDAGGTVLDAVDSYFGLRKVETRDGKVYLNGQPYYQRLVLDQGYFREGILTAPTDGDLRRDVELAKAMGFNGARKHQKVEDPRWYYWADRLGFLVWGEMANADEYSEAYVQRITAEWQEVVLRDYNHPCIIVWVPVNESWGVREISTDLRRVDHLLSLYHLTRSLDGSRLVVSNDGWEHALTDLCTIHDYGDPSQLATRYVDADSAVAQRPARRPIYTVGHAYRGEPILITEFGGIALVDEKPGHWGYRTVTEPEQLLARYDELIKALRQNETVQGFCYTQLTDVEQEVNGLLTYDREPKIDLERIRKVTMQ